MADPAASNPASPPVPMVPVTGTPVGNPYLAAVIAWLVPGMGHVYLRRGRRGLAFLLLIVAALWIGCTLQGNLYRPMAGQPLSMLATVGALGMGTPYLILRWGIGYAGDMVAPGYEYGTAFLLTAGLMNWLLVLDVLDIARGRKE